MTISEVEQILVELVCKIQELSGREQVAVSPGTRPVSEVPDFDSLNGVEVTVDMMDRLKIELDFNNVLVDDGKALTISQAAARLVNCIPKQ